MEFLEKVPVVCVCACIDVLALALLHEFLLAVHTLLHALEVGFTVNKKFHSDLTYRFIEVYIIAGNVKATFFGSQKSEQIFVEDEKSQGMAD